MYKFTLTCKEICSLTEWHQNSTTYCQRQDPEPTQYNFLICHVDIFQEVSQLKSYLNFFCSTFTTYPDLRKNTRAFMHNL